MISRVIRKTVSLDGAQKVDQLEGPLYQLENGGHVFEITCMSNGAAATVTGSVTGRFLRADEETELLSGTITDNVISITLTQNCYNVPGRFGLVVFVSGTNNTTAVYAVCGSVYRSTSDTVVDSGDVIPTPEQLQAIIDACTTATGSANTAAAAATAAAAFVPSIVALEYDDEDGEYNTGNYCTLNGKLYKAMCDGISGAFNTLKWLHLDIGYALKEMENHEIAYHNIDYQKFDNNGASTYYVERNGDHYTFGGYQATNATTMKVFLTRSMWSTVNAAATSAGRPTELVLEDGHTYELAAEYVQGSNAPSYPMTNTSSVKVGIYPGFLAKGTWRPTKGTRFGAENWASNHYSRITYSSTEYPDGIAPIAEIFRSGIVDEEHENRLYFNGYTVKIVLRDITEQLAVAPVEHQQAISAHAVNDIFWLDDGNLYRATSQILQGETIVPGSGGNCTATTIAGEFASLRAQLA